MHSRKLRPLFLMALTSAVALAGLATCKSREYNTETKANDGDSQPRARIRDNLLNVRPYLARVAKFVREEMEGTEDYTWDIDCAALPPLKFSPDPTFHSALARGLTAGLARESVALTNAAIMARASFLSYKKTKYITAEAQGWGFDRVELISDPTTDVQAFILSNAKSVLVVFRGTASILDAIVDADLVQERELGWGKIHRGFLTAYNGKHASDGIQARLFRALTEHGYDVNLWSDVASRPKNGAPVDMEPRARASKELWITGHSAGGALAQIFAADLTSREIWARKLSPDGVCTATTSPTNYVSGVVTFGAPRVGDAEFKRCVDLTLPRRNWRFVHNNDIVAQIAPLELGYRHAGDSVYLTREGKNLLNPSVLTMGMDKSADFADQVGKGNVAAFVDGIVDHFVYPQPLQHQLALSCSIKRGVKPAAPKPETP